MNSDRLKRLEPLWQFLDSHDVRTEDLLMCICLHLEDFPDKKFEHELEVGETKWKCTFKRGKRLPYPFKVL